ncbi:MAG: TerC family protein [Planctomycetota bacterium]|nr:TerC family protein [Planctomycetota bacterium]
MLAWLWVGFIVFVLAMLAIDLFLVNRKPHIINIREALGWTGVCVVLALAFNVGVYFIYEHDLFGIGEKFAHMRPGDDPAPAGGMGRPAAIQFLSGWLIEYSLSMDNIFVIALIFSHFRVKREHQHRILFWGILGALILRGIMIGVGSALVAQFEWILYLFGAILIFTAYKLVAQKEDDFHPENGFVLRLSRRLLPISPEPDGQRFGTRINGKFFFTPLFVVLLVVETTDVVFAIDSIPAIFGITRDPFLVFTSNVFAIIGLRSLYFALAALIEKFTYVKFSLAFILAFVGVKMLLEGVQHLRGLADWAFAGVPAWLGWLPAEPVHLSPGVSLSIIAASLIVGIGTSFVVSSKQQDPAEPDPPPGA